MAFYKAFDSALFAKLQFSGEFEINSVVGATIGRPPKNGLKSMKRAADDRPYKVFVIAKLTDKSKFEKTLNSKTVNS